MLANVLLHLRQSVDEFPVLPVGLGIKVSEQIQNVCVHLNQRSLQHTFNKYITEAEL